ncbi:hypothetical protein VE04_08191 [Pseudogymnoascus sp. 24MN13]|nr:hypothetical protein VE04_08191 [Pseudogymnoascus sp. 24MN13]
MSAVQVLKGDAPAQARSLMLPISLRPSLRNLTNLATEVRTIIEISILTLFHSSANCSARESSSPHITSENTLPGGRGDAVRDHEDEKDPRRQQELIQEGLKELQMLKRQATVSQFFQIDRLVVEGGKSGKQKGKKGDLARQNETGWN